MEKPRLPAAQYVHHSWAPDGDRIVLTLYAEEKPTSLLIYDRIEDDYDILDLSLPEASALGWPEWSPDGHEILFASRQRGYYSVWVVGADGSDLRRVTSAPDIERPIWSPDGCCIAVSKGCDPGADGKWTGEDDSDTFIYDTTSGSWARIPYPRSRESTLSWTAASTD